VLGCFAMTETGHGSDVQSLGTVAVYDAESGDFVLDTPDEHARKDYIGNALHGGWPSSSPSSRSDGRGHGVHAFLVPLRDEAGALLPGIEVEDCGEKVGLNGVDNGRIAFHQVRVERDALLDEFAAVDEHGEYSSPIASDGRRFFTMIGTLVHGRVAIANAAARLPRPRWPSRCATATGVASSVPSRACSCSTTRAISGGCSRCSPTPTRCTSRCGTSSPPMSPSRPTRTRGSAAPVRWRGSRRG
jgi:hypothetical protein